MGWPFFNRESKDMIAVKYIGARETYRDGAYGSGLVFVRGQTIAVEDEILARKMLRHADVYVPGDVSQAETTAPKTEIQTKDDEDTAQDARDAIANMNKAALKDYARTNFRVDIDARKSVKDIRAQVTGLFDQFGVD